MGESTDLAFFLSIVKHGTISAAARSLGISAPALSKRLVQLERRLGVHLIHRTTRSMRLTQEGMLYHERGAQVLSAFERLEQDVMNLRGEPSGVLRVNAPLNFGRVRVAPMVSKFAAAHSKLEIDLILTDHPADLTDGGFDVGFRFGAQPDSGMRARRLSANRRQLWASPGYLKRHGEPSSPKDLHQHRCIIVRRSDDTYAVWTFSRGDSVESIKVHGNLRCNDSEVALAWALEGRGILMRSAWDTGRFMRNDRLRVVLPEYELPNRDLFLVFHDGATMSAKVRAFVDFAVQELSELEVIDPARLQRARPAPGVRARNAGQFRF